MRTVSTSTTAVWPPRTVAMAADKVLRNLAGLLDAVGLGAERGRQRADVDALLEARDRELLALAAVRYRESCGCS